MAAVAQDAPANPVPTKAEADLVRAVSLTGEIARARKKVDQLIRNRDALWKRMNENGITQDRIAKACNMTPDAVYQGIRRAVGRPVKRGPANG